VRLFVVGAAVPLRTDVATAGLGVDTCRRPSAHLMVEFATDVLSELYRHNLIAPLEGRIVSHACKRGTNLYLMRKVRTFEHDTDPFETLSRLKNPNQEHNVGSGQTRQNRPRDKSATVTSTRRFPPPWSVEQQDACFVVTDGADLVLRL
jgi:hypothetical protein